MTEIVETKGNTLDKGKMLNRDMIKYLAMAAMFLNHFAHVFLPSGSVLSEVFEDIGYFTAVTMCYFLVEGYSYTRSKKKYGRRLLLFAVISQVPYCYALGFLQLDMLFTLFFCFLILVVMERMEAGPKRFFAMFFLVMITVFCDWALLAALFTIYFAKYKDSDKKYVPFIIAYCVFALMNILSFGAYLPFEEAILHGLASGLGILVSCFMLLFLYNGQKAKRGAVFSKWFFYIFYPAHLALLGLVKYIVNRG